MDTRKYTLEDYFNLAKSKNMVLVELEKTKILPKNVGTDVLVRCKKCSHEWHTTYHKMKYYGCPKCAGKARITKEDYIKLGKERNILFIDIENGKPIPYKTIIETQCKCLDCGHIWKTSYTTIKVSVKGCPNCSKNRKVVLNDYRELEKIKNITFLDINENHSPRGYVETNCKCNVCNYVWFKSYSYIKQHNCPNCKITRVFTIEDYFKLEKEKDLIFIDVHITNKKPKDKLEETRVKCNKCGVIKFDSYAAINKRKNGCSCQFKNTKIDKEQIIQIAEDKDLYILKIEKHNYIPFTWKCKNCNYIFKKELRLVKNKKYSCEMCNPLKGEELSRIILNGWLDDNLIKGRHQWLKHKRSLELDGYSETGIAFEYQGSQHYKNFGKYEKNKKEFKEQVIRDAIKVAKCKENNVKLIIIKQFAYFEKTYVLNKLKKTVLDAGISIEKPDNELLKIVDEAIKKII